MLESVPTVLDAGAVRSGDKWCCRPEGGVSGILLSVSNAYRGLMTYMMSPSMGRPVAVYDAVSCQVSLNHSAYSVRLR